MLYKLSDMQKIARKNGFAIPHFLGGNLEMTYGGIRAAEKLNSPIAFGVAPEVFASIPMEASFPMILNLAHHSKVPVAVQLEHGKNYEQIARAIRLGVNSVMYDGSALPYEENVANTRDSVRLAHALDVCVEAELGHVGGSAVRGGGQAPMGYKTDPELVRDFVAGTTVDALAVSFGNVHGQYQGKADIDLKLIKKIDAISPVPLVMHGGSGLPDGIYAGIVDAGISNIHFYSGVAMYAWGEINHRVGEHDEYPPFHEIVSYSVDFFQNKIEHIIGLLGAKDRANDFYDLTR